MLNKCMRKSPLPYKRWVLKALNKCPFKLGMCLHVFTSAPKKPCSAKRKTAKVKLQSTQRVVKCHIPGDDLGNLVLSKFTRVWIHGRRAPDMPGAKYRVVRGKQGATPPRRASARSLYGVKNPTKKPRVIRQKLI